MLFLLILCPFIVADECTPDSPPGISANEGVLEMYPGNGNATIHGNLTVLGGLHSSVPSEREVALESALTDATRRVTAMNQSLVAQAVRADAADARLAALELRLPAVTTTSPMSTTSTTTTTVVRKEEAFYGLVPNCNNLDRFQGYTRIVGM